MDKSVKSALETLKRAVNAVRDFLLIIIELNDEDSTSSHLKVATLLTRDNYHIVQYHMVNVKTSNI